MFDAVVFSGGGSRCFWQAGFCDALIERGALAPTQVAAVSAGAAMACMVGLGRSAQGLAHFKRATANNRRNFYPGRLGRGDAFPHERMYREAILAVVDDGTFAELQRVAPIHVLLARPAPWMGRWRAAALACTAYYAEVFSVRPVHPRLARRIGIRPEVVRVQDCATPDELADLILHSSCTPPLTRLYRRNGTTVLDGGAVDPVPIVALDRPRHTLVLLTKRYEAHKIPRHAGRVYAQPSGPVPVAAWDYTNPGALQATYDLGRRDGERFAASGGGALAPAR